MRPRRYLPAWLFVLVRPFFRYSEPRHAYVLRGVGRRMGPVIRRGPAPEPAATHPPVARTGRFAREDPAVAEARRDVTPAQ